MLADTAPPLLVPRSGGPAQQTLLFDDLKHFVDIHPVRHWLERRVRAHVCLCVLALLLKRVFEIDRLGRKAVAAPLEAVTGEKLVKCRVRLSEKAEATKTFWKVTTTTPEQHRWFSRTGVKNPAVLDKLVWWRTQKHELP